MCARSHQCLIHKRSTKDMAKSESQPEISDWISPDLWTKYSSHIQTGDLVEFRREGKLFQHWGLYLGEGLVVHVSSFDLWNPSAAFTERFTTASQASTFASSGAVTASTIPGAKAQSTVDDVELVELPSGLGNGNGVCKDDLTQKSDGGNQCVSCGEVTIEQSPLDLGFGLEERTKWFIKVENILRIAGRDQFRKNNNATKGRHRNPRSPQEIFAIVKQLKDHEVDYSLVSSNCEHFVTSVKYKQDGKTNEPPDVVPVVVNHHGTSSQVRRVVQLISMAAVAVVGLAGTAVGALIMSKGPPAAAASSVPAGPVESSAKTIQTDEERKDVSAKK